MKAPNQTEYEIARDIITLLQGMAPGSACHIEVTRHTAGIYWDWTTDVNQPCGWSETASAIREAARPWQRNTVD